MEPVELGTACTSCPDGRMVIQDEYVYCPSCDQPPSASRGSALRRAG